MKMNTEYTYFRIIDRYLTPSGRWFAIKYVWVRRRSYRTGREAIAWGSEHGDDGRKSNGNKCWEKSGNMTEVSDGDHDEFISDAIRKKCQEKAS